MTQEIAIADGRRAATMNDNQNMTEQAASPVWGAPFAKRAWAELRYALVTLPLSIAAIVFIVPMLYNGALWAASADGVWKLGAVNRLFEPSRSTSATSSPSSTCRHPTPTTAACSPSSPTSAPET